MEELANLHKKIDIYHAKIEIYGHITSIVLKDMVYETEIKYRVLISP